MLRRMVLLVAYDYVPPVVVFTLSVVRSKQELVRESMGCCACMLLLVTVKLIRQIAFMTASGTFVKQAKHKQI